MLGQSPTIQLVPLAGPLSKPVGLGNFIVSSSPYQSLQDLSEEIQLPLSPSIAKLLNVVRHWLMAQRVAQEIKCYN